MQLNDSSMKSSSIVGRWKQCIVAGNQHLLKKDFDAAACQYEFARQYAETIFANWLNPYEATSALVVTYHNIADLQRMLGKRSEVLFYLEKAHKVVLRELLITPVGNKKHKALMSASKRTYLALVSYKKCGVYS